MLSKTQCKIITLSLSCSDTSEPSHKFHVRGSKGMALLTRRGKGRIQTYWNLFFVLMKWVSLHCELDSAAASGLQPAAPAVPAAPAPALRRPGPGPSTAAPPLAAPRPAHCWRAFASSRPARRRATPPARPQVPPMTSWQARRSPARRPLAELPARNDGGTAPPAAVEPPGDSLSTRWRRWPPARAQAGLLPPPLGPFLSPPV